MALREPTANAVPFTRTADCQLGVCLELGRDLRRWQARYSTAEFRAAIETAAGFRKRVYVDTHATSGARAAVEAGVAALEHCYWVVEGGRIDMPQAILDQMSGRPFVKLSRLFPGIAGGCFAGRHGRLMGR